MQAPALLSRRDRLALLRLLAVYLAFILAWQGLAAALALGAGPLHQHRPAVLHDASHPHAHADGERHLHTADDATVQPLATAEDADLLAFALTCALALLALGSPWLPPRLTGSVRLGRRGWVLLNAPTATPFRPPRHA